MDIQVSPLGMCGLLVLLSIFFMGAWLVRSHLERIEAKRRMQEIRERIKAITASEEYQKRMQEHAMRVTQEREKARRNGKKEGT